MYQPIEKETYEPSIEPTTNPKFAVVSQAKTSQTRASDLKRSSMLPATTMEGMAESTPVANRPIRTAASDGIAAMTKLKIVHRKVEAMYSFLRPKDSEIGGKNTPPNPCPNR